MNIFYNYAYKQALQNYNRSMLKICWKIMIKNSWNLSDLILCHAII